MQHTPAPAFAPTPAALTDPVRLTERPEACVTEGKKLNLGVIVSLISLVIAVLIQASAVFMWGGTVEARLTSQEAALAPLRDGSLARVDERTRAIQESVMRIERRVEAEESRR